MTRRHLVFLLGEQGLGAAVINVGINAGIAWLAFRKLAEVPLWGAQSIVLDTIATCFMLPFMTCVISTPVIRWQVSTLKLPHLSWRRLEHRTLGRLPPGTFRRAVVLGLFGLAIAVPTIAGLALAGVGPLSFQQFVVFKALYAAVLASLFSPVIALCVLGDIPPKV